MRLLLFTVILFAAGCAINPEAKYLQAETTFQSAVVSLINMRSAGMLEDRDVRKLTPILNETNKALRVWRQSLIDGNPRPDLQKVVLEALKKILEIKQGIEERNRVQ